jgi:antitoxin (DNA-binding transcriptional repressor) of toxin-antitoxin stability system
MITVSVAEAKSKLPELLRAVETGERVTITRHGKPVAELGKPANDSGQDRFSLEAIRDRQRARGLSEASVPVPDDFNSIEVFEDGWMDQQAASLLK